ncbi:MAG TPA: hypothetical protein DIT05_19865 [Morganella sp. (in: Bacteria)]|nr:hypothetical protein [Morganella sp. (in: enterobacteria)]
MKLGEWAVTAAIVMMMAVGVGWQETRIDKLKGERDSLSKKLSAQQAIFDTHLKLTAVMNGISQINVSQREQTAKDTEEVKTVIKTVFVGNDCADAYVPSGYTDELRRFRDGEIHTGSGATNAASTDR